MAACHAPNTKGRFALAKAPALLSVGDALCVAFARVSDAVTVAFEAKCALKAEDFSAVGGLPVRMGLQHKRGIRAQRRLLHSSDPANHNLPGPRMRTMIQGSKSTLTNLGQAEIHKCT